MALARFEFCLGHVHPTELIHQINVNSWARDPYVKKLADGLQTMPFPDAVEEATEVFAKACERLLILFGSAGKA